MTISQPRTSTRQEYPWIGKTVKEVTRVTKDDSRFSHLRIDFTDGSSVSFTATATPDWDDAAYWADDDADAVDIEIPEEIAR